MKPPIPYFGSKSTLAPQIVTRLPEHGHYVEPFCGSLAVLMAKPRSQSETVNDIDGDLMCFWRMLRDRPDDLERACALTPHSRSELEAAWSLEGADDLERARRVFVQLTQGRGSTRRSSGWRHYTSPGVHGMQHSISAYVRRLAPAAERLAEVTLESRPALDVIERYGKSPDVLLYVDPPYLAATRSSGRYVNEMGEASEHHELLDALVGASASVVLSGYGSELYAERLAGWDRVEMAAYASNAGVNNTRRTEVLWSNRPISEPDLFAEGWS